MDIWGFAAGIICRILKAVLVDFYWVGLRAHFTDEGYALMLRMTVKRCLGLNMLSFITFSFQFLFFSYYCFLDFFL